MLKSGLFFVLDRPGFKNSPQYFCLPPTQRERFNSMSERKQGLPGSGRLPGSDRPVAGARGPACSAESVSAAVLEAVGWWWMIEANTCILHPRTGIENGKLEIISQ